MFYYYTGKDGRVIIPLLLAVRIAKRELRRTEDCIVPLEILFS
jgi:hypothetical protein